MFLRADINIWHTDHIWRESPTSVELMLAEVVPPAGGDLLFVSTHQVTHAASLAQLICLGHHASSMLPPSEVAYEASANKVDAS